MIHLNEYVKGLNEVRLSDLKGTSVKVQEYNYHPKKRDELIKLIKQLIKERGNNADLNDIDTSDIDDMSYLFSINGSLTRFEGDISKWDTSNVTDMDCMFHGSQFNGDISDWDVSKVERMYGMFWNSNFNGDISNWDVSSVTFMPDMFRGSDFDGDISRWNVDPHADMEGMFYNCPLEERKLPKWYKEK